MTHCSESAADFYLFILSLFLCFVLPRKKHSMGAAAAANTTRSICLSSVVHEAYKERPSLPKHTGVPKSQAIIGHNEFHYCFWNSIRAFLCTHLSVKRWYYSAWQLDTCTKNKKRSPWGRKRQGREDASWLFFSFVTNSCCQEPCMQRGKITRGFGIKKYKKVNFSSIVTSLNISVMPVFDVQSLQYNTFLIHVP